MTIDELWNSVVFIIAFRRIIRLINPKTVKSSAAYSGCPLKVGTVVDSTLLQEYSFYLVGDDPVRPKCRCRNNLRH